MRVRGVACRESKRANERTYVRLVSIKVLMLENVPPPTDVHRWPVDVVEMAGHFHGVPVLRVPFIGLKERTNERTIERTNQPTDAHTHTYMHV